MKNSQQKAAALLAVVVLAMLAPDVAYAQAGGGSASTHDLVINSLNTIETKLLALAENTQIMAIGKSILITLVVVTSLWALVKGMATGRFLDQVFGDLIPVALGAAIGLMLMGAVPGVPNVATSIDTFMKGISAPLLPAGFSSSSRAGDIVSSAIGQSLTTIIQILDMPLAARASVDVPVLGAVVDMFNFINMLEASILKVLVTILCGLLVLISLGLFIGTLFVSQIAYIVALVFLPIFVAFIVFKPLSNLFQQWLSFLTTALFTKVVGLMMLQVTATLFSAMGDIAQAGAEQSAALPAAQAYSIDISRFMILILLSGVSALLMMSIKSIASGIIGSIAVGFEGWSSLVRGPMNQGLGGGMGKPEMASPGSGGGGRGGNGQMNDMSPVTKMMPNALKPITSGIGTLMSNSAGKSQALSAVQKAHHDAGGASKASTVYADTSKMSSTTAQSFQRQIDATNDSRAAAGMNPLTVSHPRNRHATTSTIVTPGTSTSTGPTGSTTPQAPQGSAQFTQTQSSSPGATTVPQQTSQPAAPAATGGYGPQGATTQDPPQGALQFTQKADDE